MLENLQPSDVFMYFEEISRIPHGSLNTKGISDYLVSFAKKQNLFYKQDEMGNVIIIKEATKGMEDESPIIIQGHMDMVAVKDEGCEKDLQREGLSLENKGDFVYAKQTSLGADDGIAVAYALALLAGKEYVHPRLEVVITVDEEIGLLGAGGIDLSVLKGKTLLNIDSEKEGELTVACAGGLSIHADWELGWIKASFPLYEISISGLTGGHSGTEIGKRGANANQLLLHLIYLLGRECSLSLVCAGGGTKDNVIPSSASCTIAVLGDEEHFSSMFSLLSASLQQEWQSTDPQLSISSRKLCEKKECAMLDATSYTQIMTCFMEMPNGVQAMSESLPGLVQTSLNFGVLKLEEEGRLKATFSLRSSVLEKKEALAKKVEDILKESGAMSRREGDYPAWEYKENSIIRDKMVRIYKEMFQKEPTILSIHAGLECGIFTQKIEGLDCISFGPDIFDIHTTAEKLSISSTQRTWEFLKAVLSRKG